MDSFCLVWVFTTFLEVVVFSLFSTSYRFTPFFSLLVSCLPPLFFRERAFLQPGLDTFLPCFCSCLRAPLVFVPFGLLTGFQTSFIELSTRGPIPCCVTLPPTHPSPRCRLLLLRGNWWGSARVLFCSRLPSPPVGFPSDVGGFRFVLFF